MRLLNSLREGGRNLLDLLYPNLCLGCGEYIDDQEEVICPACDERIDDISYLICGNCQRPLEQLERCPACESDRPLPIAVLGEYIDPLKEIIHQFKFHYIRRAARSLGERLLDKQEDNILKCRPEIIVPVPLHSLQQKKRGFNQAADLAEYFGHRLDLPVLDDAIEKARHTRDQVRLSAERRRKNLGGAFRVDGDSLESKRIAIVDDVLTTGATMEAVCEAVTEAGGKPCLGIAIAVTR